MFFNVFFFLLQESKKITGFMECEEMANLAEIYDD